MVDCEFPVGRIRQLTVLSVAQSLPAQLAGPTSGATLALLAAPA